MTAVTIVGLLVIGAFACLMIVALCLAAGSPAEEPASPPIMPDFVKALGDQLYRAALREEIARKIYDAFEHQVDFDDAADEDARKDDAYISADAVLDLVEARIGTYAKAGLQ